MSSKGNSRDIYIPRMLHMRLKPRLDAFITKTVTFRSMPRSSESLLEIPSMAEHDALFYFPLWPLKMGQNGAKEACGIRPFLGDGCRRVII